jgi:phenylalanyl-tRNA synthetase beta chain
MQASIKMGRNVVGVFGVIHPAIREHCDLRVDAFYAEMDARLLCKHMTKTSGIQVSDFPAITRDITLQVERKEQAGRVLRLVKEAQVSNLSDTSIVDDFQKNGEDFRRVTYRMTFQSGERTLKHDDVDAAMAGLLGILREKHGVQMAV